MPNRTQHEHQLLRAISVELAGESERPPCEVQNLAAGELRDACKDDVAALQHVAQEEAEYVDDGKTSAGGLKPVVALLRMNTHVLPSSRSFFYAHARTEKLYMFLFEPATEVGVIDTRQEVE
jgi:hypothetical protein